MTVFYSILFGLVEGLTEFVPVSSTAHMLLLQRVLGIPASTDMFSFLVIIQLGAILALLLYFRRDFWSMLLALFERPFSSAANRQAWFVLIATLPALLAGLLLKDLVEGLFGSPLMEAAIRLLTAAAVLSLAEWLGRQRRGLDSMTGFDALRIGLFQVLSIFPGASRSASAIGGGMLLHLDRAASTRFAFLLSPPVMLAAGAYEMVGVLTRESLGTSLLFLPLGLLVACVAGWFSIRWLINFVSHHRLYAFAAYCAALGVLCLALQFSWNRP